MMIVCSLRAQRLTGWHCWHDIGWKGFVVAKLIVSQIPPRRQCMLDWQAQLISDNIGCCCFHYYWDNIVGHHRDLQCLDVSPILHVVMKPYLVTHIWLNYSSLPMTLPAWYIKYHFHRTTKQITTLSNEITSCSVLTYWSECRWWSW